MANQNATKDDNNVSSIIGTLSSDGTSTVRILGTSGAAEIVVASGSIIATEAQKDDNDVSTFLLTSSVDGTAFAGSVNSSGKLLIEIK